MEPLVRRRLAAMSRLRKSDLPSRVAALPRRIVTSCDGCGFDKPWIVETKDRYGLRIAVLVCPRCTLISQSSRLTPEAAALFYAGMYRPLVSTFHGSLVSAEAVE